MVKRAILSVSDKTGIVELARRLADQGVTLLSTGGTMKAIEQAGISVTGVSDVTGFPECLDGRVKTLHPAIHAGLLAVRENPEHMKQLEQLGVEPIDMVVINLYPFRATIEKPGVTFDEAIENIDIGGPTMLRAAAKNAQDVVVVIDPADYDRVLTELETTGDVSLKTKRYLQYKGFEHNPQYDCMIQQYLRSQLEDAPEFPQNLTVTFEKVQEMRYGENPHQKAAFYRYLGDIAGTLPAARQLHGKELSYNNINDTNGALELLREFDTTAVIAVKHGNPCGVGVAETVSEAYKLAYEADPVSVFGGIVVTNGTVDAATAEQMSKIFLEIIVSEGRMRDAQSGGRPAGAGNRRQAAAGRRRLEGCDQSAADGKADGGFDAGVEDRQACEIQRHCDCQGQPEPGHRAGAGQPHLEHADGHRAQRRQGARRGAGERRLLPV